MEGGVAVLEVVFLGRRGWGGWGGHVGRGGGVMECSCVGEFCLSLCVGGGEGRKGVSGTCQVCWVAGMLGEDE